MSEALANSEFLVEVTEMMDKLQKSQKYVVEKIDEVDDKLARIDEVEETVEGFDSRITANTTAASNAQSTANSKWTAVDASTETKGIVKVDGETINVDKDGVISSSGGSGRNIGEVFYSLIPLVDATVHLLNGGLIYQEGIYQNFVNYMVGLYEDGNHNNLFVTEAEFQQSIYKYGVCGKFVWDSVEKSLRLPKVTGLIEGTVAESAIGALVEAGLPNLKGATGANSYGDLVPISAPFYRVDTTHVIASSGSNYPKDIYFDASLYNSIYGNSNTVQPQAIKGYVYIVLANAVKTQIEVDIDEITTDLNDKADVDLTNCTKPYVTETWHDGTEWYRVWSDGWIEQGGNLVPSGDDKLNTITFHRAFSNTSYFFARSAEFKSHSTGASTDPLYQGFHTSTKTTTGVQTYVSTNAAAYYWFACGY